MRPCPALSILLWVRFWQAPTAPTDESAWRRDALLQRGGGDRRGHRCDLAQGLQAAALKPADYVKCVIDKFPNVDVIDDLRGR